MKKRNTKEVILADELLTQDPDSKFYYADTDDYYNDSYKFFDWRGLTFAEAKEKLDAFENFLRERFPAFSEFTFGDADIGFEVKGACLETDKETKDRLKTNQKRLVKLNKEMKEIKKEIEESG